MLFQWSLGVTMQTVINIVLVLVLIALALAYTAYVAGLWIVSLALDLGDYISNRNHEHESQ